MSFLDKQLHIKNSNLKGAGKGLFTKVEIRKGTRIVEYKGRIQRWKEVKHEDGHNGYLMYINRNIVINAQPAIKALARYANDARGLVRLDGIRNNSEYVCEGNRCFIESTKIIKKGEEILVYYGREYWALIKRIKKLEAGHRLKAKTAITIKRNQKS